MPNVSTPLLQPMASTLPRELSLALGAALRAQDKHNTDVASSLNKALVLGDTLLVATPYTSSSPLVVPDCWTTVSSFSNSWVDVGSPWFNTGYMKDEAGWVHLRGALKSGTLNTTAFVLPAGFRPGAQWANAVYDFNASAVVGMVYVDSSGNVKPFGTSNVELHLDGVYFPCTDSQPYVPSCFPFDVAWPKNYPPTLVAVQCLDASAASPSNLAMQWPDCTYVQKGGKNLIHVRNIPGLLPSKSYSVTVVAF